MGELVWKKWHQLTDTLRVSLDSTLQAGAKPEYLADVEIPPDLERKENKMIHRAREFESKISPAIAVRLGLRPVIKENYDRHAHPGVELAEGKVAFKVHIVKKNQEDKLPYLRFTFWKRGVYKTTHSSLNLKCGRLKELKLEHQKAFGFNANSRSRDRDDKKSQYLPLSYPGTGIFEPLFVKVSEHNERAPYYLKIEAHDEPDNVVVVEAREVDSKSVPVFLVKA